MKEHDSWWIIAVRIFGALMLMLYVLTLVLKPFLPKTVAISEIPVGIMYFSIALLSVDIATSAVRKIVFRNKGIKISFKNEEQNEEKRNKL